MSNTSETKTSECGLTTKKACRVGRGDQIVICSQREDAHGQPMLQTQIFEVDTADSVWDSSSVLFTGFYRRAAAGGVVANFFEVTDVRRSLPSTELLFGYHDLVTVYQGFQK
jgi:hypothetical protein